MLSSFNKSTFGHKASGSASDGKQLHNLLRKLNYGDVEKYPSSKTENYNLPVDPSILDWVFNCSIDSTKFVSSLCSQINDKMIVTEVELKEYADLERMGKVLHGKQLDEALELGENFYKSNDDLSIEDLERHLDELTEELDDLENKLEKKKVQRDKLSNHYESLQKRTKKHQVLAEKRTGLHQAIQARNTEYNKLLSSIKSSVEGLVNIHTQKTSQFLSYTDLEPLMNEDRLLWKELEQFINSYYEEIDDTHSGDDIEKDYEKHSQELKRLASM